MLSFLLSTILILYPGDPIPRINLPAGWTATVYAEGLSSLDGLALSPDGSVFFAEESAGSIGFVASNGQVCLYAGGFSNPEGIAFDSEGTLYIVEDTQNGSLFSVSSKGKIEILTDLDAPEGVTINQEGNILITESNVQFTGSPLDYRTSVTEVFPNGSTVEIQYSQYLWSYSGITTDNQGTIYVCNEASGTGTTNSIFKIDPSTGVRTLFVSGLIACEGLRFNPSGTFPLYVVEEDLGSGNGQLSVISSDGSHQAFATGFLNIEDVLIDENGNIYVSEDTSGMIILLEPDTGVEETSEQISPMHAMTISPNPFNSLIEVSLPVNHTYPTVLSMFDTTGRIVFKETLSGTQNNETYTIATHGLTNGNYFLQINDLNSSYSIPCVHCDY